MKLLISTQSTIEYDGNHYYGNSVKAVFNRYKYLSDDITFICHVKRVTTPTNDIIGENINFVFIKKVNTIKAVLKSYSKNNDKIAKEQVQNNDVVIVHLPSDNGYQVIKYCKIFNKPYMTVVCGCSWDALWNHGWQGKLLAPSGYFKLKKAQKESAYSIYVTNEFLQNRYPTKGQFIGCSNVNIHTGIDGVLEKRLLRVEQRARENEPLSIGTAAALDVVYKGQEYVIRALSLLKKKNLIFEYHLIGRGDFSRLKGIAVEEGVEDQVFFHGSIPHDQVLDFLDKMDIYVQPSKQEGLPRSLIEAMSRGCLCLGSRTAGIPELLEEKFVFEKGDAEMISKILGGITLKELKEQAKRNYEEAKNFDMDVLNARRKRFVLDFINAEVKK